MAIRENLITWCRRKWSGIAVFTFFSLGWVITAVIAVVFRNELLDRRAETIAYELFVNWSAELLFLTVVGLAITILTIERTVKNPASAELIDRIKILLGSSEVPVGLLSRARYSGNNGRIP